MMNYGGSPCRHRMFGVNEDGFQLKHEQFQIELGMLRERPRMLRIRH